MEGAVIRSIQWQLKYNETGAYLDDVGVLGIQEAHQVRQNFRPAHNRVPGENGGDNCSESVTNIGIGISNVAKGQGLDVFQDILPDITAVHLNVGLE